MIEMTFHQNIFHDSIKFPDMRLSNGKIQTLLSRILL